MRFSCGCSVDEDGTRLESCPKPGTKFCDHPRQPETESNESKDEEYKD